MAMPLHTHLSRLELIFTLTVNPNYTCTDKYGVILSLSETLRWKWSVIWMITIFRPETYDCMVVIRMYKIIINICVVQVRIRVKRCLYDILNTDCLSLVPTWLEIGREQGVCVKNKVTKLWRLGSRTCVKHVCLCVCAYGCVNVWAWEVSIKLIVLYSWF